MAPSAHFGLKTKQDVQPHTTGYLAVLAKCWRNTRIKAGRQTSAVVQQDGATPHTSNLSLAWLHEHFGDCVISKKCALEWAPHSPDFNAPDFYLWGFLKDCVYKNNPQTIADLKKKSHIQSKESRNRNSFEKAISIFSAVLRSAFSVTANILNTFFKT